jgi:LmbE family N-acetylglucosaminyl deacetylase
MLAFPLAATAPGIERVLALGCHADDLEIGCGGLILALTRARADLHVTWVVLAAHGERGQEARASAERFLAEAGSTEIVVYEYRDGFLPYQGGEVKDVFESLKRVQPDLVLTHARHDLHQDHRLACELTWNTFRKHLILEFEIPKYDGDLGVANVFFPLVEELVEEKIRLVREGFPSQSGKHWFDAELLRSVMRLRGMECATRYAEAFTCRKLRLSAA